MSKPDAVAVILWAGATLYAVFGGADFGAGFWHLVARGHNRRMSDRAREQIGFSIGPVWEANHVWLIFILVVLWTGFPTAFAAIMETLYVPLALAALGIVLRGAGFAFGHAFEGGAKRRAGNVFSVSSVVTPFFMGAVVGAIAAGNVTPEGGDVWSSWIVPLPLLVGALFVVSGVYISAVFLHSDARRRGDDELADYFAFRAAWAAVVAGVIAIVGILVLRWEARFVFDGLTSDGLPLLLASVAFGIAAFVVLLRGAHRGSRPLAVAAVVAIIWGWAVGQHPYLFPTSLTIEAGAGAASTLNTLIVVFFIALAVVGPSLALLYSLAQRRALE